MRFAKLLAILSLTLGCAAASNAGEYEVQRFDTPAAIIYKYFDGSVALFKKLNHNMAPTHANLYFGRVIRTP